MSLKNQIPLPAWLVYTLFINIQWALLLEVMEMAEQVGGINNILYQDWLILIASYSIGPAIIFYLLCLKKLYLVLPPFIVLFSLDLLDLLEHFEADSPYAPAQFILFMAFWILPSVFLLINRRRFAKKRMLY